MTSAEVEAMIMNLDTRTTRIEQILPTLATKQDLERFATKQDLERFATKDELREAVSVLATKDELRAAISVLATKDELRDAVRDLASKADLAEVRLHSQVLFESLKDDIRMLADGLAHLMRRANN